MSVIPVRPQLKDYNGRNEARRRKVDEFNAMAQRVVDHVNILIANNPNEIQEYNFHLIAIDLGLSAEDVQSAIMYGGHNGITLGVGAEERRALERNGYMKKQR